MEGVQRVKSKRKRLYLLLIFCLLLSTVGVGATSFVFQKLSADYRSYSAMAQTGLQHLKQAIYALETLPHTLPNMKAVDQAQSEFGIALVNFEQVDSGLSAFPGAASYIPVYGARLDAALRLATIAVDISQAGAYGCAILHTLVSEYGAPLGTQNVGINQAEWTALDARFQQVEALLTQVIGEVSQLHPGDVQFIPHLGDMLTTFQSEIPTLQMWLTDGDHLLSVLSVLLGISSPANYLIELLDSTELRPTGGFIGNVGIATVVQGKISAVHITDVDLLDKPFKFSGHTIPYPPAYQWFTRYLAPQTWSLRDSNLDADFPTAARYGELNYAREGGNVPLQGVISITPALIEQLMEITGPIYVPEYQETVTAQNLVDRIHYHQLGAGIQGNDYIPAPGGHSSLRKQFTELLSEHFVARLRQLPASALSRCMQALIQSIYTKDVQVYFNAGAAESLLQQAHLDGSIQSPLGDSLFIVDTNVGGDKANRFITSMLNDQVSIDMQGNAIHQTTITYAWLLPGSIYGRSPYQDYVRIYVPPGSILQSQQGWEPQGSNVSFGCQVWVGYFTLTFGQTRTITLTWKVPGASRYGVMGWNYPYLIQHQAGTLWTMQLHIIFPSTCELLSVSSGQVDGKKPEVTLNQSFSQNVALSLNYIC